MEVITEAIKTKTTKTATRTEALFKTTTKTIKDRTKTDLKEAEDTRHYPLIMTADGVTVEVNSTQTNETSDLGAVEGTTSIGAVVNLLGDKTTVVALIINTTMAVLIINLEPIVISEAVKTIEEIKDKKTTTVQGLDPPT